MHGGYVTASTDEMDSMVCGISLTKNIEISSSTEYLFGCKVMSFVREKRICFYHSTVLDMFIVLHGIHLLLFKQ